MSRANEDRESQGLQFPLTHHTESLGLSAVDGRPQRYPAAGLLALETDRTQVDVALRRSVARSVWLGQPGAIRSLRSSPALACNHFNARLARLSCASACAAAAPCPPSPPALPRLDPIGWRAAE